MSASAAPATYSDGSPLDRVQALEFKLILKPDRFTAAQVFLEFNALVGHCAKQRGIGHPAKGVALRPQFREVLFYDTPDFRLYNNAFILRRRIAYTDGFPEPDPEIVLKFRHPDRDTAAALDLRPRIAGRYRVKFKAEVLPLQDRIGGLRTLYSHNLQFRLSQAPEGNRDSLARIADTLPPLQRLEIRDDDRVGMVNATYVEEVLQDLGVLDFGKGVTAAASIAIWRDRATHRRLCGEFGYEVKFDKRSDLPAKAEERAREFFLELQQAAHDWLSLGTTETGLVYRLKGNPPQAHE